MTPIATSATINPNKLRNHEYFSANFSKFNNPYAPIHPTKLPDTELKNVLSYLSISHSFHSRIFVLLSWDIWFKKNNDVEILSMFAICVCDKSAKILAVFTLIIFHSLLSLCPIILERKQMISPVPTICNNILIIFPKY